MTSSLRKILVIVGTTGAGKTKLSIDIAKAIGGEIINSDAMQMYKGLNIATAKITQDEKEGIPHHLFDIIEPWERCDVVDFKKQAIGIIEDIIARGKVPIVVGGTMYYLQSILWKSQLLENVTIAPENNQQTQVVNEIIAKTTEELYEELCRVDPVMSARLHPNNRRKILRSLEIFYQTGMPYSYHLEQQKQERDNKDIPDPLYNACAFWVHCKDKEILRKRLEKRVNTMLESGIVEEVRALHEIVTSRPPPSFPPAPECENMMQSQKENPENCVGILQAIGYKEFAPLFQSKTNNSTTETETIDEVDGKILENCINQLNIATRQYAQRQLTWLRNKFFSRIQQAYEFDTSDVSSWDKNVQTPAVTLAKAFLANELNVLKDFDSLRVQKTREFSDKEKFRRHICQICDNRQFTGDRQWEEHLKSKSHRFHLKCNQMEQEGEELDKKSKISSKVVKKTKDIMETH